MNIGQVWLNTFLYIQLAYYWANVRQDSKWKFIESGNYGIRWELIYNKVSGCGVSVNLISFNYPEGYVSNDSGSLNYVYQYKDHFED
ncbi:hypothetical protein [Tenacibaculum litopenaei]|uniref:hypothetical protein n=1 Tax=Tenacibaculum litopenaei TaxID=396016 RepID=UPI0038B64A0A